MSTSGQLFSLANPRLASIEPGQSETTLEILPSAKKMTLKSHSNPSHPNDPSHPNY